MMMITGAEGGGNGEMSIEGYKLPAKVDKFWGSNVQHDDCNQQYCIIFLKVAKSKSDVLTMKKKW